LRRTITQADEPQAYQWALTSLIVSTAAGTRECSADGARSTWPHRLGATFTRAQLRHVSEARMRSVAAADVADAATAAAGSATAATDTGDAATAAAWSATASGAAGDAAAATARSTTAGGATGIWGSGRRDAGRSSGRGGGRCGAAGCFIATPAAANRQNEHGRTAENRNRRSSFRSHQTPHSRDSAANLFRPYPLGRLANRTERDGGTDSNRGGHADGPSRAGDGPSMSRPNAFGALAVESRDAAGEDGLVNGAGG
jgi:hypothetical protein